MMNVHGNCQTITSNKHGMTEVRRASWLASRTASALVFFWALVLASVAQATPITYMLQVYGGNATGSLNGVPFSNAKLVLTFNGDTANVMPYSIVGPSGTATSGYQILQGTAAIQIFDLSNTLIDEATFLPSAGIYVSVDSTNGGIGFGSHGALPTSVSFPGEPVYPEGMLISPPTALGGYDLTGYYDSGPHFAISCAGFPGNCSDTPFALPTTKGDLVIYHGNISSSIFNSYETPVTSFSDFTVQASATTTSFQLTGSFTLGAASNGINPVSDAVSLSFGPYSVSIEPGAFQRDRRGNYTYVSSARKGSLTIQISPKRDGSYGVTASGTRVDLTGISNPVAVNLTIGDDSGDDNVTLRVRRRDD